MRLSDGGHYENLALLPLLEKRLEKIAVFDGSCNPGGDKCADSLLNALKLAGENYAVPLLEKMAEMSTRISKTNF